MSFGRLKTPGLAQTAQHYRRQLQTWTKLEELEIKPQPVHPSPAERTKNQEREASQLLKKIQLEKHTRHCLVLLDERGQSLQSQEWFQQIQNWENAAHSCVHLVIGSSGGFSEQLRKQAHHIFSLGPQTLSHELARIVLLEQIYRAYSIKMGHPYHVDS